MALIDVDKTNPNIQHLFKHTPEGHWDIYQIAGSNTEVLLVSHDVRNRLGYEIVDTLVRRVQDGADLLCHSCWNWGMKSAYNLEYSDGQDAQAWLEKHQKSLKDYQVIRIDYRDPVVLRFESDFIIRKVS